MGDLARMAAPVAPSGTEWGRHLRWCGTCGQWWLWAVTEGRSGHRRPRQVVATPDPDGIVILWWEGRPSRATAHARVVAPGTYVAAATDRLAFHTCPAP